jgi:hypothetical protein
MTNLSSLSVFILAVRSVWIVHCVIVAHPLKWRQKILCVRRPMSDDIVFFSVYKWAEFEKKNTRVYLLLVHIHIYTESKK